jgi:hypothetical protein
MNVATTVDFTFADWDTDNYFDPTNPGYLTVPLDGWYLCTAWLLYQMSIGSLFWRQAWIFGPGGQIAGQALESGIANGDPSALPPSGVLQLQAGDKITLRVESTGGDDQIDLGQLKVVFLGGEPPAPPPVVYFRDDFPGVLGTLIPPHSPSIDASGFGWRADQGSFDLATGGAECLSDADEDCVTFDSQHTNYTLTVNVIPSEAGGGNLRSPGVLFRYQSISDHWLLFPDGASGQLVLYIKVGGVYSAVSSTPFTFLNNTQYQLRVLLIGDAIVCSVDGVVQFNVTDARYNTSTRAGLRNGASGSAPRGQWVNVLVAP